MIRHNIRHQGFLDVAVAIVTILRLRYLLVCRDVNEGYMYRAWRMIRHRNILLLEVIDYENDQTR